MNVIVFKEREGNGIGGKGIICKQNISFSLPTFPENKICYAQGHEQPPVICIQGGGTTSSGRQHGPGISEEAVGYMSHDLFSTKFLKDGHTDPLAATDYKEPPVVAYIWDARGNGRGGVSPTITGDHQNRITDYTAIVVKQNED